MMEKFNNLIALADKLLGIDGCPWDKEQTLFSLQKYLIEEAYEVVQAIDYQNRSNLTEELGDLLYNIIFISKLGNISLDEVIDSITEKIIRRHPHIFQNLQLSTADDVKKEWDRIKTTEEKTLNEKHNLIEKNLPLLMRAQKIVKKNNSYVKNFLAKNKPEGLEESFAYGLLKLIVDADEEKIQMEDALRRLLIKIENEIAGD